MAPVFSFASSSLGESFGASFTSLVGSLTSSAGAAAGAADGGDGWIVIVAEDFSVGGLVCTGRKVELIFKDEHPITSH